MRLLWILFLVFSLLYKAIVPFFFFLLTVTTAPEDTLELVKDGRAIMQDLNRYPAIDLLLILLIFFGIVVSFGYGNWRIALHWVTSKPRLKKLSEDAKRVAEDVANTLSQDRQRQDDAYKLDPKNRHIGQDTRFLNKHMLETHAVIERLKDVGYWRSSAKQFSEIGIAGATHFAAEDTSKALYAAGERIRCDLEDGFISLLIQPQSPPKPGP